MSIRKLIEDTDTYRSFSFIQKTIISTLHSQKDIEHALEVIRNIGYEKWEEQSNLSSSAKKIVKELTTKLQIN